MKVIARFELFGENYEFRRDISDFDRNDTKEPFAYFNERIEDGIWIGMKTRFEITLMKNRNGELIKDYAFAMVYMVDAYGKETPSLRINDVEVEFGDTIDDEPKYLNPPEPDGIKAEIEYLKDKMLDTTKRLPNANRTDGNETSKPKPEWEDDYGFYWIIGIIGACMLIGFIISLIIKLF